MRYYMILKHIYKIKKILYLYNIKNFFFYFIWYNISK